MAAKYTLFELQQVVRDFEGEPIVTRVGKGAEQKLTFREAARHSLNATYQDEQPVPERGKDGLPLVKRLERYDLAKKIWSAESQVELTAEEQVMLKECLGKMFGGEALYDLVQMVEQKKQPAAEVKEESVV
jgi:hypothetical protein